MAEHCQLVERSRARGLAGFPVKTFLLLQCKPPGSLSGRKHTCEKMTPRSPFLFFPAKEHLAHCGVCPWPLLIKLQTIVTAWSNAFQAHFSSLGLQVQLSPKLFFVYSHIYSIMYSTKGWNYIRFVCFKQQVFRHICICRHHDWAESGVVFSFHGLMLAFMGCWREKFCVMLDVTCA